MDRETVNLGNKNQLGLFGAITMVVASMIGVGVFTTSGFLAADLGSRGQILAAWGVGGVIALTGALNYASLSRLIPGSGGEYLYLSRLVHPVAGYLGGWISLIVGFSAPLAAAAILFGTYSEQWIPYLNPKSGASLILVVFTLLQFKGFQLASWVHKFIVSFKVFCILIFIGCMVSGIGQTERFNGTKDEIMAPFSIGAFSISLYWIYFSYAGWNAAVYMSREIREPEKNVGKALIFGTLIVVCLYLGLNYAMIYAVPLEEIAGQELVASISARAVGGRAFETGVSLLIMAGQATSISAMIFLGPRVYGAMSSEGFFPRQLSGEKPPFIRGVVFQSLIAMGFIWTTVYSMLLKYIGFMLSVSSCAAILGMIFYKLKKENRGLKIIGWPVVPFTFVGLLSAQIIFSVWKEPATMIWGIATLALGMIFKHVIELNRAPDKQNK
ncbi:MAG: amino acid permease [Verrucomicrobia bacterium]|nr:amino acid permease [Verrucomicrobiota bacterium]